MSDSVLKRMPEAGQLLAQFAVIVDLAVEGDGQPAVRGSLWLRGALGIDDAQPPRAHRHISSRRDDRVGDVAAVKDALDQPIDNDIRLRHADGDGESAHASYPCSTAGRRQRRPLQIAFTMPAEW